MNKNVLVVTPDPIREKMAGIGLRHWELSHSLAKFFSVTLATPHNSTLKSDSVQVTSFDLLRKKALRDMVKKNDIVISQGYIADLLSDIVKENKKPFVIDLICPYHLEELEFSKIQCNGNSDLSTARYIQTLDSVRNQLEVGDFFICAGEKQRDYWLGLLSAENRLSNHIYQQDKDFKKLIDIVPFGFPSIPPKHRRQMIKGVWKDIKKEDFIVLWGGGIWNWFDPLTLIKAMAAIWKRHKDIKFVFICSRHPNESNPAHRMTVKAATLSRSLGLYDKNVFFYSDWVPYQDRENYLLESDIGVVSHFDHIENRFSFRTRIMDYLWAGLPIISTKGDCMSNLIEKHELGIVVDYENVNEWKNSILTLYKNKRLREKFSRNIKELFNEYTWDKVSQPLIEFCKSAQKRKKMNEKRIATKPPFPIVDFIKNNRIKRALVLRSSPLHQFFDSMRLIKKILKDVKIDIMAQEDIGETIKKRYPKSHVLIYKYKNFDKKSLRDKELQKITRKKYDLLIYTLNSCSYYGYKNVEDFVMKFNSKFYLALNRKGIFYKIEKNNKKRRSYDQ